MINLLLEHLQKLLWNIKEWQEIKSELSILKPIAFIDTEIDPKTQKILDIGSIKNDDSFFHSPSISSFIQFINGTQYIYVDTTYFPTT